MKTGVSFCYFPSDIMMILASLYILQFDDEYARRNMYTDQYLSVWIFQYLNKNFHSFKFTEIFPRTLSYIKSNTKFWEVEVLCYPTLFAVEVFSTASRDLFLFLQRYTISHNKLLKYFYFFVMVLFYITYYCI